MNICLLFNANCIDILHFLYPLTQTEEQFRFDEKDFPCRLDESSLQAGLIRRRRNVGRGCHAPPKRELLQLLAEHLPAIRLRQSGRSCGAQWL